MIAPRTSKGSRQKTSRVAPTWKPFLSEKMFLAQVVQVARLYGWLAYHTHDSRHSAAGFPDLTCCHPTRGEHFYVELKTATGKLSPAQKVWIAALRAAGQEVYEWRPADWEEIVARLAPPPPPSKAHTRTAH